MEVTSPKIILTDAFSVWLFTTEQSGSENLKEKTERPVTVEIGTNVIVGKEPHALYGAFQKIMSGNFKKGAIPPLWDGKLAERVVTFLSDFMQKRERAS